MEVEKKIAGRWIESEKVRAESMNLRKKNARKVRRAYHQIVG